jgi:MSHA biogenesis protein MshJ
MKQYWQKYAEKIDSLSLRERMWIFLAISVVLLVIANSFLIEPLLLKQKSYSQLITQQQGEIKAIQAQLQSIVQQKNGGSGAEQKQIDQLKQQLTDIDLFLKDKQRQLVEPEKIAGLLEEMLNKNRQLQLVELKTLPVSTLAEALNTEKNAGAP